MTQSKKCRWQRWGNREEPYLGKAVGKASLSSQHLSQDIRNDACIVRKKNGGIAEAKDPAARKLDSLRKGKRASMSG
jgi:hypothetical protein